jgi:NAD(P) transhydrogenase
VTLMESRTALLASIDQEIVRALLMQFDKTGITIRLGTQFKGLKKVKLGDGRFAAAVDLASEQGEETQTFDAVLYCMGRTGNHENLGLEKVGLKADERGNIHVNRNYQTEIPHVYAVGDIIGAPALAASSAEQGRLASLHAFTGQKAEFPDTFPYGIYTIPEISSVGFQETHLADRGIKYVVGKAQYSEIARGKMIEDEFGFLKLVVHSKTRRVVGIHIIGTSATELVHIGQVAISFGATVDFFVENVFNYPTLAEAYKVAAHNAINQLKAK